MSVSDEDLMAFADGELDDAETRRIEAAIAADPALAEKVAAQARLRTLLHGHLDPIASEPVPEALTLMIAAEAAREAEEEMIDAPASATGAVLDFDSARSRRDAALAAKSAPRMPNMRQWRLGGAIAAALVLGLFFGARLPHGTVVEKEGSLFAAGPLAQGLDTQLATDRQASPLKVLTSFQRADGSYCRVYENPTSSGIACRNGEAWQLERTFAGGPQPRGDYRQAGSAASDAMAAAQNMAAGEPLDARQERKAAAEGWR